MNITDYGFNDHFAALAAQYPNHRIGRILSQEKGRYQLISDTGELSAAVSGKFQYQAMTPSDFPAVGDFVVFDGDDLAVIQAVLPRKSVFVRKSAGTSKQEQVVAANLDTVFICMSLNNDFNIRRLERYLSAVYDSGAAPVIVFTKSDLCENPDAVLASLPMEITIGADILFTSSLAEDGCKSIQKYLLPGKTVAFVGSSGVGKSTLINRLTGTDRLATGGLRNDDKGHHTTTHRELILLESGAMVIDTPGMRELGMFDNSSGIDTAFSEIEAFSRECRFHDCTHTGEPGCRVLNAIETGELSPDRLEAYRKLKQENEFSADSRSYLAAKKEKFKNIAKVNKSRR